MRSLVLISLYIVGINSVQKGQTLCEKAARKFKDRKLVCVPEQQLGEGANGAVFLVYEDEDSRHPLKALKVIERKERPEPDWQRMRVETEALSSIKDHSHVIRFFDAKEKGDTIYILMEYCPGESLVKLWNDSLELRNNPFFVLKLLEGVVRGLDAIHQAGYAMMDLKPLNIIFTENLTPKIIDLGGARKLGTLTLFFAGTLSFVDPRVWEFKYKNRAEMGKGLLIDEKYDIFAFGVMIRVLFPPESKVTRLVRSDKDAREKVYEKEFEIASGTELMTACLLHWCTLRDADRRPSVKQIQSMLEKTLALPDHSRYKLVKKTTVSPLVMTEIEQFKLIEKESGPTVGDWRKEFEEFKAKFKITAVDRMAEKELPGVEPPKKPGFGFFKGLQTLASGIFGPKEEKLGLRMLARTPSPGTGEQYSTRHFHLLLAMGVVFLAVLPLCCPVFRRRSAAGLDGTVKEVLSVEGGLTTGSSLPEARESAIGTFGNCSLG